MKKLLTILTALASLTIAAQAQLKKPFIHWGWYFDRFGIDSITTEYWWSVEKDGIGYYGVCSSKRGFGYQTTFFDTNIVDTLDVLGRFIHLDNNRRPFPDSRF
jgi:hypothetical protein